MRRRWCGSIGVVIVVVAAGLLATGSKTGSQDKVAQSQAPSFAIRLSEAKTGVASAASAPRVVAQPLPDAEARALLSRLPALEQEPADVQPAALRPGSLPPPRTGKTVDQPFPPASAPTAETPPAASGPLTIVRRAPEGDVPLAPHVSVTFSQPMVDVTAQDDVARIPVPVKLTPPTPGEWRWVGTQTVVFQPAVRLPMATDYEVEIPAGTRSATGGTLETAVRWKFSTPPVTLTASYPYDRGGFNPVLFAAFDQAIDARAVLASVRMVAGSEPLPVRMANAAEVEADETVKALAARAEAGRWLAFRADTALPPDTKVVATLGRGTPSSEGPRRTTKVQQWSFRTPGPLKVRAHRCGWGGDCGPGSTWRVTFSNALDEEAFSSEQVEIEPAFPGVRTEVSGDSLLISGMTVARTAYVVRLSAKLRDVHGQVLGESTPLTFRVGAARPTLIPPPRPMVVLDPEAKGRFSVQSAGIPSLNVILRAVTPTDWLAYQARQRDARTGFPGRIVHEATVPVNGPVDAFTETAIDLAPALQDGLGQAILVVQPAGIPRAGPRPWVNDIVVWIQATRIALDAFSDANDLVAWTSSLADGRPMPGVSVTLGAGDATSDQQGLCKLPLSDTPAPLLVAKLGRDVALLPMSVYGWNDSGWRQRALRDTVSWYIAEDRHLYRPGEVVKVKGWVREIGAGPNGDVQRVSSAARSVSYQLRDSRRNPVAQGTASLNAYGGFDFSLALPPNMNLGPAPIEFEIPGAKTEHTIRVEEFRRPEFEVSTKAGEGPHFVGNEAQVAVTASYFAGGPLANADLLWTVTTSPGWFTPPNRDDFTFGTWVPWWYGDDRPDGKSRTETLSSTTDSKGQHTVRIEFGSDLGPRPTTVRAEAAVRDVNRQSWSDTATLLVHPAHVYVGLKTDRYFVQQGQPLIVDFIVVDLDGVAVSDRPVVLVAERLDWQRVRGRWAEVSADRQECRVASGPDVGRCTFKTPTGGEYRITARVMDQEGRKNETEIRRWVSGGRLKPQERVEEERATLIPDRRQYKAGDVAEVLVVAPFPDAEGVVTLQRAGLLRSERFSVKGTSHTIRIPIEEGWTPNLHLRVDLAGATPRVDSEGRPLPSAARRPAFAGGELNLEIPPAARTLHLSVAPAVKALEPGASTRVALNVKDASGRPVSDGEVALFVVDEAVLSLTGYRVPDPVALFYRQRGGGVDVEHMRSLVLLARDRAGEIRVTAESPTFRTAQTVSAGADLMPAPPAPSSPAPGGGAAAPAIRTRVDFNPLALFAASVITDANGKADVELKVPDNLTRYRIMAVAVAKDPRQFGSGESTITARLPLMVRPSPPRFLNFGDRAELPVMVQNQTDAPLTVNVALRALNAAVADGAGRRLTVPAHDRVEVRFPVATVSPGTARFQVAAAAGSAVDAASFSFPVWTPATTEAFATYGQIDSGAIRQPVSPPAHAFPQFGGLRVTTSSTALQALTDAVLYLVSYPYECSEQLASRILAVAALRDVLAAFGAAGLPPAKDLEAAMARDLARLEDLQNDDGGFALWKRGDESWPYVTVHAMHALARAKARGFKVDSKTLERGSEALFAIEQRMPSSYPTEARHTVLAYSLHVRKLLDDADPARARELLGSVGIPKLSFEALGWLLGVLSGDPGSTAQVTAIRRHFNNQVTETAAAAHFAVDYRDSAYLLFQSNRRADAVILEALIGDQPANPLIPKIVEGLLAHRTAGRWTNTQENVFVLLALDRYFRTYEKVTPDFVARVWLGDAFAGEHAFKGRTTERAQVEVPMATLAATGTRQDLVLAKEGPGRLYYRIGMQYAPTSLDLKPLDRGFTVERTYQAVDRKEDVRRDSDGTWRIAAGARVRVRLTMLASGRRTHVALVDPIPAGFEPLNPALKTTGSIPQGSPDTVTTVGAPGLGGPGSPGRWWMWERTWYEHQNLRDERVEAFASLLWEGLWTYEYVVRATTPGLFVVPPARAEEMYAPETFGRSGTERVRVDARDTAVK